MLKPSNPAVVVFCPFDVVLSEVISALHFNDDNILLPRVHDPMPCTLGNIHSLAALQLDLVFADGHDGGPTDYIPVFPSVTVPLETQTLLREYDNPFHFMVRLIGKDAEITPWPVFFRFWGNHTRWLILPKRDLERAAEKSMVSHKLARPPGVEPGAFGFVVQRSIQLSYGRSIKSWRREGDSNPRYTF